MTKLNVAIVGCGAISKVHIQSIKTLQMSKLSLACDCNEVIAREVAITENIDYAGFVK
jgi:predicted dehydrogenase